MIKKSIVFVNSVSKSVVTDIKAYAKKEQKKYNIIVLRNSKLPKKEVDSFIDEVITVDFAKPEKIVKALLPFQKDIIGITCFGDKHIPDFKKIIPYVPYVRTPTAGSLGWASNKILMRTLFAAYDKKMTPPFVVINDASEASLKSIKKKVSFPLVLKPAGLASSLLVTLCFHEEELQKALKKMFTRIQKFYTEINIDKKAVVLVEGFMDGEMYSVDAYVTRKGKILFCPFVHIKTGRSIGFDDFFGYKQLTPTTLSKGELEKAMEVGTKGIYALGLRNSTAHIELMKTDDGWKLIEIGARVGGFRDTMYKLSFGIKHSLNDVLLKIGKTPVIPGKRLGYTMTMKIFSKKEGRLEKIVGIRKINKLASIHQIKINKQKGDKCTYAKNGGKSVLNVILHNKQKSDLLADVRRIEKTIDIILTEKRT